MDSGNAVTKPKGGKKKVLLIISAAVLVLAAVAVVVFLLRSNGDESSKLDVGEVALTERIEAIKSAGDSDEDIARLVDEQGPTFGSFMNEVTGSDPTTWSQETVAQASFCLAFLDKIEDFTSIFMILGQLDTAQASGVDINIPSSGIDQAWRDRLLQVANERLEEAKNASAEAIE